MRSNQAKQIPISKLLERLGIHPEKEMNNELWYCSPFRHETKASFKLSKDRRAWFDHGSGQGGNIFDFVMQYEQTGVHGPLYNLSTLQNPIAHSSILDSKLSNIRRFNRYSHIQIVIQ